jgi:abortive infection bacteriophage resistance protein
MTQYNKPPLTHSQQVSLLASRGLVITDQSKAEQFLSQVNYYRFSAYCLPFEVTRHKFQPDVKFEQIQQLYEFDRRLRFLIDEALEIIEISFRTALAYYLSRQYDPFVHEDPSKFYTGFDHPTWIAKVHEEIERSKETFINHYRSTYDGFPRLPLWMAVEVMSFGALSQLYSYLLRSDQIAIAKTIGLHHTVLHSWLHTFSYVRNMCAQHSRIWNRELAIAMTVPRDRKWIGINAKRVGSVIFAINTSLKGLPLDPNIQKDWHHEMGELLNRPAALNNFYHAMGLPEDFQKHDLWK